MIRFTGEHDVEWVSRFKICFNAENPNVYVERIHNTVETYQNALSALSAWLYMKTSSWHLAAAAC